MESRSDASVKHPHTEVASDEAVENAGGEETEQLVGLKNHVASDEAVENAGGEETEQLAGLKNYGKFVAGAEDATASPDLHLPSYCRFYVASTVDASLDASDAPKLHLPSPKRKKFSPLKAYEEKQITKRKRTVRWTKMEEDALKAGVVRFGEGSWKEILKAYPALMNRTGVNLKDKWRNLQPNPKKK